MHFSIMKHLSLHITIIPHEINGRIHECYSKTHINESNCFKAYTCMKISGVWSCNEYKILTYRFLQNLKHLITCDANHSPAAPGRTVPRFTPVCPFRSAIAKWPWQTLTPTFALMARKHYPWGTGNTLALTAKCTMFHPNSLQHWAFFPLAQ